MKSRGGKSQRREEKEKEDQGRERARRQKMQVREKVAKSRNTVFFQWLPEGRKVSSCRLAKAAGTEPCGQMRDEKLHAVVARSTFPSQHAQNLWKLWCRKGARRCGSKHISKSKCAKHVSLEMFKKCTPLWREAHFQVKMLKHYMLGPLLKFQMWFCVAGARDSAPCQKWPKREGFVAFPKTMAGVGFRVAGAVQETCSSEMLGGQGADFLRRVAFWSVRSSVLGRWFCVTGAALRMTWHQFFVAGAIL